MAEIAQYTAVSVFWSLLELTKLPIEYFRFIIKTEARKMVLQQKKAASTKAAFYQI